MEKVCALCRTGLLVILPLGVFDHRLQSCVFSRHVSELTARSRFIYADQAIDKEGLAKVNLLLHHALSTREVLFHYDHFHTLVKLVTKFQHAI